jgi:DNA repair exonuclease SbcCD ATPase subunit
VLNLPNATDSSLEPYVDTIRAFFDGLASETALNFASTIRQQSGALDIFTLRKKIKETQLKINELLPEVKTLKETRDKATPQKSKKEIEMVKTTFNIGAGIEIFSFVMMFIAFRDNVLLAICMGALTGAIYSLGIKGVTLWTRDGSGKDLSALNKRLIWGFVLLGAIVFGILRYWLFKSHGNGVLAQSPAAPFVFCILSVFLVVVFALCVVHYYPTPFEELAINAAANLDQQIEDKERLINDLEKARNQYEEDCNTIAQIHTQLIEAEKNFYPRIESYFQKSVGVFKYHNRIKRKDGIAPPCFSQPVSPLKLPEHKKWDDSEFSTSNETV